MFKFDELKHLHLEITNNCQASCPMCNRNINSGLENPLIKIANWTLDEFKTIVSPEVLRQLSSYYFCGSFGDPILNNELIDMCQYSKDTAPGVGIDIHTNGGARNTAWWESLARALPVNHNVIFALDGLEDTHHLYRVGTKFETVIENARAFIEAGGRAEWAFIKFKHNEHQVEDAKRLAKEYNFNTFVVKNSSRFILEPKVKVLDRQGNITHFVEPSTETPIKFISRKTIEAYKEIVKHSSINCKVAKTKEVYIDAHKNFFPCCWLANVPYTHISDDEVYSVRKDMLDQHYKMVEVLGNTNTIERSIKDIIESNEFQTMWDELWTNDKLISCVRTCGISPDIDFSQPDDQFTENHKFNE